MVQTAIRNLHRSTARLHKQLADFHFSAPYACFARRYSLYAMMNGPTPLLSSDFFGSDRRRSPPTVTLRIFVRAKPCHPADIGQADDAVLLRTQLVCCQLLEHIQRNRQILLPASSTPMRTP